MAMPENRLSTTPVIGSFIGAASKSISNAVDYEDGPIGLSDPTEGMNYQEWRGRVVNDQILIMSDNTEEYVEYAGVGISNLSIAFDQNGRLHYIFREGENYYLHWFNPQTGLMENKDMGTNIHSPRMTLDDKRIEQSGRSDIILAYINNTDGSLCMRQQRDRYDVEYVLDAGPYLGLEKIGKADTNRLQFLMTK